MTSDTDLHVVLGASGGAGNAIARALYDAGIPVRAVNRSGNADLPGDVERDFADITSAQDLRRVLGGAAVVDQRAHLGRGRRVERRARRDADDARLA